MCKLPPVSTPEACASARQCLTESWQEYTGACWRQRFVFFDILRDPGVALRLEISFKERPD
jgi:hypothetical protein